MWVKKSEGEKKEEERLEKISNDKSRFKKSLKSGLFIFIFTAISWIIASLTIGIPQGRYIYGTRNILKLNELPEYIPEFLRISAILGFVTFVFIFFLKVKLRSSTIMCDKCHKTKNYDKVAKCECGGNFINIDNFKWVDD